MISLKQINYAIAVAETLHFKKAAEACNVSQSALSTAIHELEKHLSVTLFERNNKNVFITTQGELFLQKARNIKLEVDDLYQMAQLDKSPLTAPMTIGVIPTIGPYLLPKVLPAVRKAFPNFKLKIIEEQSHVLVDMVRKGDIDTAILALPYPLENLISFDFWQEDFYWVSHQDECPNSLKEITSNELALEKLMLLKDGHCLKDHALAACSLSNKGMESSFDSTSLHTIVQMVAGKLGTTLVPHMALDQLVAKSAELRAVHLNEPGPHRRISFVIRPNYVRTKDIDQLKALFSEQMANYSKELVIEHG